MDRRCLIIYFPSAVSSSRRWNTFRLICIRATPNHSLFLLQHYFITSYSHRLLWAYHDLTSTRCCIYKERAILRYRMLGLLGYCIENEVDESKPLSEYARDALARQHPLSQPSMTVLDEACKSCASNKYLSALWVPVGTHALV